MTAAEEAARGRPRDPELDRAILGAALRLMACDGYARMSLEAVAAEAGVGKATIYRRHRDKAELAVAALTSMVADEEAPATGDARADVVAILDVLVKRLHRGSDMRLLGALLSEEDRHPELLERFRAQVIAPRRAMLRHALAAGVARGELSDRVDLDLACDALVGPVFARHLAGQAPPGRWAEEIVAVVWGGVAVRG